MSTSASASPPASRRPPAARERTRVSFTPLIAVTCALAAVAPFAQAFSWRVPFGQLSTAMVVRTFVGTFVTTGLAGLLAIGCFAVVPVVEARDVGFAAAVGGGSVGGLLLLLSVTRMRHVRGVVLLSHRCLEPDARAQALASLRRLLARARPADGEPADEHARLVFLATAPLGRAGLWEEMEGLLVGVDPARLGEANAALHGQTLSSCRIHLGDVDGAQAAIDAVARPAPDPIEPWLVTTEALVAAVRGDAARALELVGEESDTTDAARRASERIVRAHAWAARAEHDRARRALELVRAEAGRAGLEQAALLGGPASDLADELLDAEESASGDDDGSDADCADEA